MKKIQIKKNNLNTKMINPMDDLNGYFEIVSLEYNQFFDDMTTEEDNLKHLVKNCENLKTAEMNKIF